METKKEIERSELWNKIHSIVKQIPRMHTVGDAMDAPSASTEIEVLVKSSLTDVGGNMFSNEELQTIKIDILHIYDKVSLGELEVHKRNLILNKIKAKLGNEF